MDHVKAVDQEETTQQAVTEELFRTLPIPHSWLKVSLERVLISPECILMVYLTLLPNQTKLRHEEALSTGWERSFKQWRYIRHCFSSRHSHLYQNIFPCGQTLNIMFLWQKVVYLYSLIYRQVAVSNSMDFHKPQNRTQTIKMSNKS